MSYTTLYDTFRIDIIILKHFFLVYSLCFGLTTSYNLSSQFRLLYTRDVTGDGSLSPSLWIVVYARGGPYLSSNQ